MALQFIGPGLTGAQALSNTAAFGGSAFTGQLIGESVLYPLFAGLGDYLRGDTGILLKDRLRQGDIPGAFTAVTGFGRSDAPRLEQQPIPGFDPNKPVTIADLRSTAQEVYPLREDLVSRREYEAEKRRAEQLAAQDQLTKKYRVADLTAQYNSASTPEEKQRIGLQIWATTNPQLAQSVSPRQVGYEQAQAVVKPPKDDKLDQTQKALLKQAFQRQLKK